MRPSFLNIVACWLALGAGSAAAQGNARVVEDFSEIPGPARVSADGATLAREGEDGARRLAITFEGARSPEVTFAPRTGKWRWTGYKGLSLALENPGETPVTFAIVIDSRDDTGRRQHSRRTLTFAPGEKHDLPFFFYNGNAGPYWGMRGIPVYGPMTKTGFDHLAGRVYEDRVTEVALRFDAPQPGTRFLVGNLTVFALDSPLARLVPHPFIDRFGQYIHGDWPEKTHSEAELREAAQREAALVEKGDTVAAQDTLGGWKDGPQLEATGWFRTEKVDGAWWLVTPEGHLFLSFGVCCVHPGESTFIEGRDSWFEWLPENDGPFAQFLGSRSGSHSMAETIGGGGQTFDFHRANLLRKYGDGWETRFRETAYARLRRWGFNTLGNWADGTVLEHTPIPFTVTGHSGGARPIAASSGYWRKMKDVFDPQFVPNTEARMGALAKKYADNPLVIGYYVDNEESWSNLPEAALASPPEQPARQEFIRLLREKYGALDALNAAWDTAAGTWDAVRLPLRPTGASKADAFAYEYHFAKHYFTTIRDAIRKHDPHHLYLGCRFTPIYCPPGALKACAEVCGAISINFYGKTIDPKMFAEYDKPVMVGEYHFGTLDNGMFHPGLQGARTGAGRTRMFTEFVESVLRNPMLVGCHWFKYADQPTTGRSYDGENYAVGLINVVDNPYTGFVNAARELHNRAYNMRAAIAR